MKKLLILRMKFIFVVFWILLNVSNLSAKEHFAFFNEEEKLVSFSGVMVPSFVRRGEHTQVVISAKIFKLIKIWKQEIMN